MKSSTKEFYEKLSRKELSDQKAYEAKNNFVGFFDSNSKIEINIHSNKTKSEKSNKLKKIFKIFYWMIATSFSLLIIDYEIVYENLLWILEKIKSLI